LPYNRKSYSLRHHFDARRCYGSSDSLICGVSWRLESNVPIDSSCFDKSAPCEGYLCQRAVEPNMHSDSCARWVVCNRNEGTWGRRGDCLHCEKPEPNARRI